MTEKIKKQAKAKNIPYNAVSKKVFMALMIGMAVTEPLLPFAPIVAEAVTPTAPIMSSSNTSPIASSTVLTVKYSTLSSSSRLYFRYGTTGTWQQVVGKLSGGYYEMTRSITANGTYQARSADANGVYSATSTITINNLRGGGGVLEPVPPTIDVSTTDWTDKVTVTLSGGSFGLKEYKLASDGVWQTYDGYFLLTQNDTIYARTYNDNTGERSSEESYTVTNIDSTPPTISLTPSTTSPTNQSVGINVSMEDLQSGLAIQRWSPGDKDLTYFSTGGGIPLPFSGVQTVDVNGVYSYYAKDNAGKESLEKITISNIDNTAPANATFSADKTSPTNQNVNVTINYPADASIRQYKIGSTGTWTTYTAPISVGTDNTTIFARSYDQAGNASSESSYSVTNIDKTAPSTPTLSADVTAPTSGNVTVTATFPADASVKQYSINGGAWTSYVAPVVMTNNGTLQVRAGDFAGNYSNPATYTVSNIDKIAPAPATFSPSTTSPTNQDVSLTINYPADAVTKQYKVFSSGTWTTYTTPVVVSENNTVVYARSFDAVGNVSVETNDTVTNIDKVAPTTPTISADVTAPTNGNVILTASFPTDASVKEYSLNDGAWTSYTAPVTFTSNGKLEVRAKDSAGNYSGIGTYNVTNIDKVAPANATLSASTTAPTNQNVNVTISYPTDASVKEYKIGSTGTWTDYTTPVVVSSNNTVYARSKDAVGNISAETSLAVSNIDKVAPTTPTLSADVTAPTNGNVIVTGSFPADASVKEYSLNDGAWTTYTAPVTFTSNGKLEVRAKDSAGNYSAIGTYNVTNIDKVAPANATLTASTTAPTNDDVTVSISYPGDASVKQYKVGSTGTWTTYSTPIVLSSNNTVYARSFDAVGNVSAETSLAVNNIDKVAPTTPTISADVTAPTNGNVVLTASFPGDASVKEYRLNGGSWTVYSAPITMTANGTFEARATDQAGNYSSVASYSVSNIDKTAPANATLSPSTTAPTNQNVNVTITYPADASVKQYKIGSTGTWTSYSAPVVVSSNNTVYARSIDAVGNVSAETSLAVNNIDQTAPTTPTVSADVDTPTNGNVVLTASFSADSTVKEYRLNGSSWTAYTAPITMTANGTFEARGKDSAGNYSSIGSYSVTNIDKTAPANATLTANTTSPTNQNVTVSISYPADASVKEYKIGSTGTWTAYTAPVVLSANNTVYARSKDAVGNVSAETNLVVSNIDKVAPTAPTLVADETAPTNGNVILTATFPGDASVKEYRLNGGTWTAYSAQVTMTANGKMEVRATDNAGNTSSITSYDVTNIDKTAPANATLTPSTTASTNQNVTVTIAYPADATVKEYKIGSTGTWTAYTAPITLSSNNTVYARSKDEVGNLSAETSLTVNNIDKVAPTTPTVSADVTTPTNGNVILTATFPGDASVKEYRLNGGTWTAYSAPVTMTANGTFEVRGKDVAGNYSAVGSYSVTNIDKTAPANATLTPSTTSPINEDVTVIIAYPADASVKQYKVGATGTWTAYSAPVVVGSNATIYARSYDAVGNVSAETSLAVTNIDKDAPTTPTISADVTTPTNGNVIVTASFPVDASVKEYRLNGGSWTAYTAPVTFTVNGKVEVRATDNAGNESAISSYTVSNIDKTAPANATFTPSTTSPTNQNVSVTINYPADASVKQYKVGATGTWTAYTTPVVVSDDNVVVYARSMDAVGNVSAETSYTVTNIDKVAPTTPSLSADVSSPTNGNVVVTASFPADASVKEYRLNGGAWTAYSAPINMTANGKVEVRATDNAGNVSGIGSFDVDNIDKTAPANATLSASTTAPTNQNVTVTISYPSDASVKEYKIGSTGTWTAYTTPVALSANNTVYARSKDAVGNVSSETSLVVSNIDKVAPVIPTVVADVTAPTNGNVLLTVNYPADASVKEYRLNGGTWTSYSSAVSMTANGTLEARAKDVAGNYSTIASYEVDNIDKTAPAIATLTPSTTAPTNQNVSVTIAYPSDASVKEYKIGSTGTWTAYTTPVVVSSNNTVYARSKDAVGNISSESSLVVNNIDKTAPTTPSIVADETEPTNGNVNLTVSFPADASVKEYRLNGGTWTSYTAPVLLTSNGKLEARATDNAGNVSAIESYDVTNIDKTAPANATLSADQTSPTNGNVTVTIAYPSDASVKQYKIGSTGTWTAYTTSVTLSGNNTVFARSFDAVGNLSAETSYAVTNIDKTAPNTPTVSADVTAPTNGNVVLTAFFPADASVKEYRLNGGAWTAYSAPITMTANGTFEARAKDVAGNYSSVASYTVSNIDKTAPVLATLTPSSTAPTNQNVSVTIAYPTDANVKEYKVGTGSWTAYTAPVVVSTNTTVYARSTDAVGNVSNEASLVVNNIDKVAPTTPTVTADETDPTNGNVTLTVSYPADASVKEYRLNGGAWTAYSAPVVMASNGKLEARATDNAGNVSAMGSYDVSNIDKTAPANATFSADKTAPTNLNVSVTINYPVDATVKQYKIGSTGTWTNYTAPVALSANNTVFARSYDAVGNLSSESSYVVNNIDKVAPTIPTVTADETDPTNGNVTLTVSYPVDAVVKEYRLNGGAWNAYTAPVVMTSNGKLEVRGTDNAGNVSALGSYDVTNIDKTAPVNATFTADKTAPTNTDVTVDISYPSDASAKQYKIGSTGTWTAYTTPVVLSANNTVFARSFDAVGNGSSESSYSVSNIDKVAPSTPTLSADVTAPTNGNVVLTASFPADASVKEYRLNGGAWTAYTAPITLTSNGTFEARAKDNAGNYSSVGSYNVSNIDKTAPVNATLTPSTTTPTNQNVSVTIAYPTDASLKEYKIGNGTWTAYTAPVVVSANATVYARSTDAVGNVSNEASLVVSNIDKTAPTTPTVTADETDPTNGNVVLTASFPADASVKEYRLNGGTWTAYTASVTMTANGTFEARAKDVAGNYSAIGSYTVSNIDKTAPLNANLVADETEPTNSNVTVTISYPADASVKQYKLGSAGAWTAYTAPVVVNSNTTVFARSYDAVGNVSSETSLVVDNIDKVAPNQPTVTADKSTPTNVNVTLTVAYPADSAVKEYRVNGGAWTAYANPVVFTENGLLESRAKDQAGNYSTVASYSVSNIDKTAPVNASLTASTTAPTNQDVSVTISYPSDASVKEYKIGSTGTWTAYTAPVVLSVNNTVFARSKDAVGNISAESSLTVSNIDKTAPSVPTFSADQSSATNKDVTVTVTFPGDASSKEVRVNGGTWTSYSSSIVMKENGTVEARAKDVAGNYSAIGTFEVSNIDKVAPVDPTMVASTTAPTNKDVSVTITFPSDATVMQYKLGSTGTWTSYSSPVVVSSNNTIYARGFDAVGNASQEVSFNVTNIDKTAPTTPTLNADATAPTNEDVKVTATFPADAVVKEYRLNGGSWTAYTAPITLTSNGKIEVRGTDNAGNVSAIGSYDVTNIDKTAPDKATLSANTTAPTNQNVTVTVVYPSDASVKQYKVGSAGTWSTYTSPVVVSANDTVYARSYDAVGNISSESSYAVTNIDKVAPTTPTVSADVTAPTNGNVVLTASFPADASVKEYRLNGGTWTAYTAPVTLTANGTFEARAKDVAGNYSNVGSYSVTNIDKIAPENATLTPSTIAPTNQNVNVTISYPADASVKQYKVGATGTWTAYTTPVVVSSNNTVFARSIDAVGNVSADTSLVISNIDKVAPNTPTLGADETTPTNGNVIVTATFPADASVKEVRVNGGTWTAYTIPITMSANGKVEVRATDNAGNVSGIASYDVVNIDKIAPVVPSFTADKTAPTNSNVLVTVNYPADAKTKEVRVNGGTWTAYTAPITMSANGKVEARATDDAGNVSLVGSYEVTNIDKVAPTTPTLVADKTNPTNTNVILTATFPADASVKEYRLNGGTWTAYTASVTMTANGKVEVRATDNAGNVSGIASYDVTNIDKVAPVKPVLSADKTTPTNTDVKVSVSFSTDTVTKEVRVNGGDWTVYTAPVILTANGKVEARSFDNAGNVSAIETYQVSNIDKVKPLSSEFSADKTSPTNQDVTVTVTFPADVVKKEVRVNGGEWKTYTTPIVFKENGLVEARGTDNAGNVSDVSSYKVTNIDLVVPEAPKYSVSENQNEIKFDVEEGSTAYYRINDGEWTEYTGSLVTDDGTYKIEFKVVDPAGNESEVTTIDVVMYRDALETANEYVAKAEVEKTQASVDLAKEKLDALPSTATEKESLQENVQDVQEIIDVQVAIDKAMETKNEQDIKDAQSKIDLLNGTNPVIEDMLDEIIEDFEEADIMVNVAQEDFKEVSTKYGVTNETFTALVNTYYAVKYPGNFTYQYAKEKVALVSTTDKYYAFVQEQFAQLQKQYEDFQKERVQTDAEIQAESSVKTMETKYDPTLAVNTQKLINAVEDQEIRASLQQRLDTAKAKYEASLATKVDQEATSAVERAERLMDSFYVNEAWKKVNALTNETLKASLSERLKKVEAQMAINKLVTDATRSVQLAEQYPSTTTYLTTAQTKVTALPESIQKAELQARLDTLKANLDQTKVVKDANSAVSLAQSMKTQYYVDKARVAISLVADEAIRLELTKKVDAIVVK